MLGDAILHLALSVLDVMSVWKCKLNISVCSATGELHLRLRVVFLPGHRHISTRRPHQQQCCAL